MYYIQHSYTYYFAFDTETCFSAGAQTSFYNALSNIGLCSKMADTFDDYVKQVCKINSFPLSAVTTILDVNLNDYPELFI